MRLKQESAQLKLKRKQLKQQVERDDQMRKFMTMTQRVQHLKDM